MHIFAEGFSLPKADNSPEEYEDAFSLADKSLSQTTEFRCAVADGAAQTIFSGKWARLLVSDFCNGSLVSDKLSERLSPLQDEWFRHVASKRPLPWFAEEKVEKGAYAALLGLTVSTLQLNGKVDGVWQSTAVGDCCLFQIRRNKLITRFPLLTASEFTNSPSLISTNNDANAELNDFATGVCGKWEIDDCFLLMSDAIACWFLRAFEAGEKPWNIIRDLGIGNTPPFAEWVTEASLSGKAVTPVGADWILDHKPKQAIAREHQSITQSEDWISTHKPVLAQAFVGSFLKERGLLAALLATALLSVFSGSGSATLLQVTAAFSIGGCYLLYRFRLCPEVSAKRQHRKEAKGATRQIIVLKRNVTEFEEAIKKTGEQEYQDFESVRSKHRTCSDHERREMEALEQALGQELAKFDSRQQQIAHSETAEISNALQASQHSFLDAQLRMHSIHSASIDRIGVKLKARLRISGINTAADVSHRMRHVDGIGDVKRQALQDWRQRLETQIRSRMPQTLPSNQEAAIRAQYVPRRHAIEAEKSAARRNAQQKREIITGRYRQEKQGLDHRSQEIRRASAQKRAELGQNKREQTNLLKQWEQYEFEAKRAVDAFRNITFSGYLKTVLFLKGVAP